MKKSNWKNLPGNRHGIPTWALNIRNCTVLIQFSQAFQLYAYLKCKIVVNISFLNSDDFKTIKSSPLLGPFCGSEFWGFSLLKI